MNRTIERTKLELGNDSYLHGNAVAGLGGVSEQRAVDASDEVIGTVGLQLLLVRRYFILSLQTFSL